ncbi:MAG TPA: cobalamin biosynthesis protein, partial [Desulforhopalus sp.]|nr:cobalamin biosynthesis protein [Desulforhopalus sp.]
DRAELRLPGHLRLRFFTAAELNRLARIVPSPTVLRVTGAKGVAEPAALLAAGEGGRLLVGKSKWGEVTRSR